MCTALVIGNTIGIGIFMMPAALAPYGLNSLIGWVITVLGCVAVAWVFAGIARIFPQDDGPYAYTQRAFGSPTAFMVLWCYWVSIWVTNATIATGVVGYLTALIPALNTNPMLPAITGLSPDLDLRGREYARRADRGLDADPDDDVEAGAHGHGHSAGPVGILHRALRLHADIFPRPRSTSQTSRAPRRSHSLPCSASNAPRFPLAECGTPSAPFPAPRSSAL